jgi:hypothetical protein
VIGIGESHTVTIEPTVGWVKQSETQQNLAKHWFSFVSSNPTLEDLSVSQIAIKTMRTNARVEVNHGWQFRT